MSAIVFTCFGAAYGTAKAGVGISAMGVLRPDLIVKSTYMIFESSVCPGCCNGLAGQREREKGVR